LRELQQQGRVSRVASGTTINGTAANASESVKQSPTGLATQPSMVRVLSNKRLQMKRESSGKISPASSPRATYSEKGDIPPPPPPPPVTLTVEHVDEPKIDTEPNADQVLQEPKIDTEPHTDQAPQELKIDQPISVELNEPVTDRILVSEPKKEIEVVAEPVVEVTPPTPEEHETHETDQSQTDRSQTSSSSPFLLAPVDLSQHQELRRDSTTETEESTNQSLSYDEKSADLAPNKEIDATAQPLSTDSENLTPETRSSEATELTATTDNSGVKSSGSLNDIKLRRSGSSKEASSNDKDKHKKGKKRRENLRTSQTSATIEPIASDRRLAVSQSDPTLPPMSEDSTEDEQETPSSSKSGKKFLGKIKKAFKQAMDDMHVTRHHHDDEDKDDKNRPESARPKSMREVSTTEKKSRSPLAAFVDLFKPSSRKEKTRSMSLEKETKTKKRIHHTKSSLMNSSPEVHVPIEDVQRSRSTSVTPEDLKDSHRTRHQSLPASAMSKSSPLAASAKKGPVIKPMKDIKRYVYHSPYDSL
jgi:hypothetical protein